jgi:hypothetical protein
MSGKFLFQYSNGWGHLIMSLATMAVGVYILIFSQSNSGFGVTLIGLVTTAWFVTSSTRQSATDAHTAATAATVAATTARQVTFENADTIPQLPVIPPPAGGKS